MRPLEGKHIVLGISGGIAAYKSAALLRLFVKNGAEVQVVITPNGKEFITPATLAALSGKPVVSEFFAANTGEWHSHVDLGIWADLMVVAPATASTIAKMATGVADNMLITTYLSAKEHVMVAPAMDLDMWAHPTTQRNIKTLEQDGVEIIMPASGELASHLVGKGRMEEPEQILERVISYFNQEKTFIQEESNKKEETLEGRKILITAGPTFEDIDPVRFIGNSSSGKMGIAIARECAERGAEVVLVCGPVKFQEEIPGVKRVNVRSAKEMLAAVIEEKKGCDLAILAAAVADYAPAEVSDRKIKREGKEELELKLVRNPDIAATLGADKGKMKLIGFALETDHEFENAKRKLAAKNLDAIVLNSLQDKGACFNSDDNKILIIPADGFTLSFDLKPKKEVAADIMNFAEGLLKRAEREKRESGE